MIKSSIDAEEAEKAIKSFENIKSSIKGLYDILKMNSPTDEDFYFQLATDNIIGLYHNLMEVILNENTAKFLKKKIKSAELNIDIPLGNTLLNKNKELNF
ncbi:MAG: hypothetical protein GF383_11750 [Candidatus Lokiarchaeota archaeon]|nr:hypothetical protein [Candidatus Lokiarchaeota archaeon]MBD3341454.1 hypothetical protein [Candidatus Lokiarchaeota archaeon]